MNSTNITSPKTKPSPSLSREERFFELYKLAFGNLHCKVEFEFPHPDGGGMCFTDPKERLERCHDIAQLALHSARYASRLLDEELTINDFNKKVSHAK